MKIEELGTNKQAVPNSIHKSTRDEKRNKEVTRKRQDKGNCEVVKVLKQESQHTRRVRNEERMREREAHQAARQTSKELGRANEKTQRD